MVSDDSIGHGVVIGRTLFQTCAELRVDSKAVEVADVREVQQMTAIDVGVGCRCKRVLANNPKNSQ
jgi:hypothetical protein